MILIDHLLYNQHFSNEDLLIAPDFCIFVMNGQHSSFCQDCATPMSGYLGKNSLSEGPSSQTFLKHGWVWVKFIKNG